MFKKSMHMSKSMKLASLLLADSPIVMAPSTSRPATSGPITDVPLTPISEAPIGPFDAPEYVPAETIQWSGLTAPECGPFTASYKYCALLFNEEHGQGLRYGKRDYGINLTWGEPDRFTFRRETTGHQTPLLHGEPLALHNKTGGWIRYGERKYGINLVFSDLPAYEWYIVGGQLGTVVDSEPFALWNKTSHQFLVDGARTHGINLVWAVTLSVVEES